MKRGLLLASLLVASACERSIEHPTASQVLASDPARVVVTVDGRPVAADELEEKLSGGLPGDEAVDELTRRELLVAAALERDPDARTEVKAAMIRAMLEDEIEAAFTVEDVDEEESKAFRKQAKAELSRPRGIRATAVAVFVPGTVDGRALSRQDQATHMPVLIDEAARVEEALRTSDQGAEAVRELELREPIDLRIEADTVFLHPRWAAEVLPPDEWKVDAGIASIANTIPRGEVRSSPSPPVVWVVRTQEVLEAVVPTEEQVEARAKELARDEKRRARLEQWIDDLRDRADVEIRPELLQSAGETGQDG